MVDFDGGTPTWDHSPQLRARLLAAVREIEAPVLFLHPENDYSIAPGKALSAERALLGKPQLLRIYPPVGASAFEAHNFVHLSVNTWERDVFAFLDDELQRVQ